MKIGDKVPSFELPDQEGVPFRIDDALRQGPVVLFFYPKDDTAVCTAEVCAFRDASEALVAAGATVVGVSSDDVASHRRFAERHGLRYRLLADTGGALRRRLEVPRAWLGLIDGRVTYVIDAEGTVRGICSASLQAQAHVDEALKVLRTLSTRSTT